MPPPRDNSDSEVSDKRFDVVPGTHVPEASRGRKKTYRPWEAPPLLSAQEDRKIANHQHDVNEMIMRLVTDHMDDSVPDSTKLLVARQLFTREDLEDYQGGHERALVLLPQFELTADELVTHDKVDRGIATMEEIYSDFERMGRRSAELALLRVIGSNRAEYIGPMMDELRALMGENFEDSKPKKIRVVGFDDNFLREQRMQAIAIQYKKYHGTLGDTGTEVAARHTLVLRTDRASGFDQSLRSAIQSAAQYDQTLVPGLQRVRGLISELDAEGPTHPFIAASAVKLYMYNRGTAAEIDRRDRDLKKRKIAEAAFDSTKVHYTGPEITER